MTDTLKKLEISADELELIACALETQSKILRMQAHAGGSGSQERLNAVKRLLATISQQRETPQAPRPPQTGVWGILRSLGQAV
ncbi:hypothetical protein ABMC88_05600 [Sulfitobacter sp. HNIBRBA2951]|uniref:hypothetical protein n=1 Tax=Sulfitobacter aquimarinus TaxID=3158557 RepID=UPI0032DF47F6